MVTNVDVEQITGDDTLAKRRAGWRMVKFGDVVRNVQINVDPQASGLKRYIAGEHMGTDDLHIRQWGTLGDGYLGPAFHRKFVKGQVLYGSRRTYLRKVAVADFDGICANTTFVLEPVGDELIPDLLPFIMQTEAFTQHSMKQSKGSVNPYINWKDIAWYEFALPPKDEQRRIADILWAVDKAVFDYQIGSKQLELLKSQVLTQLTTRGLGNAHCRETSVGRIPEHWSVVKIEEILDMCQYGLSIPLDKEGQFPIFRMMNIEEGIVVEKDMKYVNLSEDDFKTYKLEEGDILFNRTNSAELVGKVGIYRLQGSYVFASYLIRLRCHKDIILPEYLNCYLNSELGQQRILAFATPGVSQTNINANNLKKVLVPLPSLEEQEHIVSLLHELAGSKGSLHKHISYLQNLKKDLLDKLLCIRI